MGMSSLEGFKHTSSMPLPQCKFLPPANVVSKVMFLQVSVCPQRGVCASVHAGMPSPWRQIPPSRHPPGADTPQKQTPPWWQTPPRSRHPPEADTSPAKHAGRYGQCEE